MFVFLEQHDNFNTKIKAGFYMRVYKKYSHLNYL